MKINIVVPTHDIVPAMFAYDLAQLIMYTVGAMPGDTQIGLSFLPGTYIHRARQELMEHVLANEEDYVLWLDSDMRFPRESFAYLLQHKVAMVGINYAKRSLPTWPVAITKIGLGSGEKPERLYSVEGATGLVEVEAVGFGMVLMRMADFKNLPPLTQGAWFPQQYLPETDQWIGEDVSFCQLVRKKLGIKIMVDQDLSEACAHIGQMDYHLDHIPPQDEQEEEA
jgi:hypothetical protein